VVQRRLAGLVREEPIPSSPRLVAGMDVSVRRDWCRAAVVVVAPEEKEVVESAIWEGPTPFPYVPGLLSFREMPAIIPAVSQLTSSPDLFLLDAQGLAHPRRFGLACHFGVYFDVPAIGVAKTRLTGSHVDPAVERGSQADLLDADEVIGRVVRTRAGVKPVYVSVGHRCTLDDAAALILQFATRFRLPHPTHLAHRLSKHGRL